jgi:hypothetical protein
VTPLPAKRPPVRYGYVIDLARHTPLYRLARPAEVAVSPLSWWAKSPRRPKPTSIPAAMQGPREDSSRASGRAFRIC